MLDIHPYYGKVILAILAHGLSHESKVYKISRLSDVEATLVEPAACAVHGLDRLFRALPAGASGLEILLLGAGPTGLILAQLLRLNGAARVVVVANKGTKTRIAMSINAADEIIELDREAPEEQWKKLKEENPYGFDVVVSIISFYCLISRCQV